MNTDIRISTSYPDHPKILALYRRLGAEGVKSHVFLLCYVGRALPKGVLRMDAGDIASMARWKGEPGEFIETLVELRLLDRIGDHYEVHNWTRHNLFAATAEKRSEIAKANVGKRWNKKTQVIQDDNTTGNRSSISDSNSDSNTPSPSPSPDQERSPSAGFQT